MRMLIAGDLVPTESNAFLFANGDIESLLGHSLKSTWEKADLRVLNLEAPIIDNGSPIVKSGPNLKVKTECIKGIKNLRPTLMTVANNHIRDFGNEGWKSTKELLEQHGINYIGAGDSFDEANSYQIVEVKGKKIGFYACAEHEFSAVSSMHSGANIFVGHRSLNKVSELKEKTDYVIVLYHGGKEHYPYPTPNQQSVCRDFVDVGANLVVCQHSHCIGCKEEYARGTIIYGQGNFIFDYSSAECWKTGLIIELLLGEDISIRYIPIEKNGNAILEATDNKEQILKGFYQRSEEISQEGAVDSLFEKCSNELAIDYLYYYAGWNRIFRAADKLFFRKKLIRKFFNAKKRVIFLGLLQCETHREIMENYLRRTSDES